MGKSCRGEHSRFEIDRALFAFCSCQMNCKVVSLICSRENGRRWNPCKCFADLASTLPQKGRAPNAAAGALSVPFRARVRQMKRVPLCKSSTRALPAHAS